MEWQIRERGTDKVLTTFESDSYELTGFGSVRAYYEHEHDHAIDVDFDFDKHYICRKGEILVSESEYDALKAELVELKAQKEPEIVFGVFNFTDKAEAPSESEKEVTRYNVEEVLAEIIQTSQYSSTIAQAWQAVLEHELEMQRIEAAKLGNNYKEPVGELEEEVTRGDEIAKLVAKIAFYVGEIQNKENSDRIADFLGREQRAAQDLLATLINQGV